MSTISLNSTSFSLLECQGPKNLTNSRINGSVSLIPIARSQFQPQKRRNIGTSNRNPSFSWMATVGEKVQSPTVPTSVPVRVALELLQAGHRYLDVRTAEEFSDGHAVGAINIPYMLKIGSGMIKNPNFLEEVLEHFGKDDEIIVGCKLGKRSFMAATDLLAAARRAFKALKSLVRLQAVVRGACVRRQARIALHCMHALARLQVTVRARQLLSKCNDR